MKKLQFKKIHKHLMAIGIAFLAVAVIIFAVIGYFNSPQRQTPLVYSNYAMLYELWNTYKAHDLGPRSGRTIDHSLPGNITTSEGESYTMLRAVWMDDQTVFNKNLTFIQKFMQRPDHLFSWKYGQLPNGQYGINKTNGSYNTASDADTNIALALLMAYSRWNQTKYLQIAKPIITSIWNNEVVQVAGKPVMTADNLEAAARPNIVVNPSYFNPAAYKIFAKIDPQHNWLGLASNSYAILQKVSISKLGSSKSDGLPPNWIDMNRYTGAFLPNPNPSLDTNYGYNAFRIPFNLALDWAWFHDPRDKQTLSKFSYLKTMWQKNHLLDAVYYHNGTVKGNYQSPAMYGGSIGYFIVEDPSLAKTIYRQKLATLYSPDKQSWSQPMGYYNDNWAWFGIALTQGALPNLTTHT